MASWMVHLRIADKLLKRFPALSVTEFIMGSIAPDSGLPNEDWTVFTPDRDVSHFRTDGKVSAGKFQQKYLTPDLLKTYSQGQRSFYLGYYAHLVADELWRENLTDLCKSKCGEEYEQNRDAILAKFKKDWWDLDHLYLIKHPMFRAFLEYKKSVGFENTYMDEFSADAFDNRRAYIAAHYRQQRDDLERDYQYVTEQEKTANVMEAAEKVAEHLRREGWFAAESNPQI